MRYFVFLALLNQWSSRKKVWQRGKRKGAFSSWKATQRWQPNTRRSNANRQHSFENAGHSQISAKTKWTGKTVGENVQVGREGRLTLGNVKPMDPPIYSLPSEFSDTILSENIRRADHEEKIVKIGRKSNDTGAYLSRTQTIFNSLATGSTRATHTRSPRSRGEKS